jgi:hypothetical protein
MFPSFQSLGTKPWHIDELNIVVIGFDIVALSSFSWKYANSKRKTNTGISELKFKSEEGEERKTTTDKEKAEVLASFFSSVFTIEPEGDLPLMHPIEVKQECIEKTYKESEILKLLQNMDVNKSCGPDGLHPKMLKELSATISKLLSQFSHPCQEFWSTHP